MLTSIFFFRSNVNVTFWDKFGERFEQAMNKNLEKPVIIILSACKVGKWNGMFYYSGL